MAGTGALCHQELSPQCRGELSPTTAAPLLRVRVSKLEGTLGSSRPTYSLKLQEAETQKLLAKPLGAQQDCWGWGGRASEARAPGKEVLHSLGPSSFTVSSSDPIGVGWAPSLCIFNKPSGHAETAIHSTAVWEEAAACAPFLINDSQPGNTERCNVKNQSFLSPFPSVRAGRLPKSERATEVPP